MEVNWNVTGMRAFLNGCCGCRGSGKNTGDLDRVMKEDGNEARMGRLK
jgi:hypothetical protein